MTLDTRHKPDSGSPELIAELDRVPYRPAPNWLGNFTFWWRGSLDLTQVQPPPGFFPLIWGEVQWLKKLKPEITFNTVFVQRYEPNQNVKAHRDPKNNKDVTIISLYGDFELTYFRSGNEVYEQKPGDIFIQDCTKNGVQGPVHEMWWPQTTPRGKGTRYAIILNRIED